MSEPTTSLVPTTINTDVFTKGGGALATPGAGGKPTQPRRVSLARIGFFGGLTKGETSRALIGAGIESDEFYLADEAGPFRVPKPFQGYVILHAKFQTKNDPDPQSGGKLVDILPDDGRDQDLWDAGYRPHLLALVMVRHGGDLIPAVGSFRNALLNGFEKVTRLSAEGGPATKDGPWASRGAAQKAAVDAKLWPSFRVCGTFWGESGDFYQSFSTNGPTPAADIPLIADLIGPSYRTKLEPVAVQFRNKVDAWSHFATLTDEQKAETNVPY